MPSRDPERRNSELLSEADKVLADLAERVASAKRERRRARRLRRETEQAEPKPES